MWYFDDIPIDNFRKLVGKKAAKTIAAAENLNENDAVKKLQQSSLVHFLVQRTTRDFI